MGQRYQGRHGAQGLREPDAAAKLLLSLSTGHSMPDRAFEGRQSAIDMMVLKALTIDDMHGWGISQYIQRVSRDVLQLNQGSLYPALHRLERDGFIRAEWRASENNRRAKYYRLTAAGRRQLDVEHESWTLFSQAVQRVMQS
jgi:transcriptional regulator